MVSGPASSAPALPTAISPPSSVTPPPIVLAPRRPDVPCGNGQRLLVAGGLQHHGLGGESGARAQQAFELARGSKLVEPAERGDDLLAHLVAGATALDDLQVAASGGLLFAEVHRAIP